MGLKYAAHSKVLRLEDLQVYTVLYVAPLTQLATGMPNCYNIVHVHAHTFENLW